MPPTATLKDQLEQYKKRVQEFSDACEGNEAVTKSALILPLFTILGYDVADPRQCVPEYKAEFGPGHSKQPVDWAFLVNGSLAFLVEAKAAGKELGRHDEQLRDYYAKASGQVKLGILTRLQHFEDLDH